MGARAGEQMHFLAANELITIIGVFAILLLTSCGTMSEFRESRIGGSEAIERGPWFIIEAARGDHPELFPSIEQDPSLWMRVAESPSLHFGLSLYYYEDEETAIGWAVADDRLLGQLAIIAEKHGKQDLADWYERRRYSHIERVIIALGELPEHDLITERVVDKAEAVIAESSDVIDLRVSDIEHSGLTPDERATVHRVLPITGSVQGLVDEERLDATDPRVQAILNVRLHVEALVHAHYFVFHSKQEEKSQLEPEPE